MNIVFQCKALGYSVGRLFGKITITDWYGIKMRVYPFEQTPIKKLITRENYNYEFEMYRKYVRGIALDIGANIGIHSVYLSRLAETVYAFEPVPNTFERLKENIALNKTTNIQPVCSAVGESNTTMKMNIFNETYSSWNSFATPDSSVKPVGTQTVPVITLDTFAEQKGLEEIGFIKIDVEGYELSVLKGASRLLSQKRIGVLSFEITNMHGKDTADIFKLLRSYGYVVDDYDPTYAHRNYYAVRAI